MLTVRRIARGLPEGAACFAHPLARPLAALGLLLATAGAAQAQTPATFAPATTYGTGGDFPQGLAVADVTGRSWYSTTWLTTRSPSAAPTPTTRRR